MRFESPTAKDYWAALAYLSAKTMVIRRGFWSEASALASVHLADLTETALLREAAWVVLSAGLSELVVRRKFDAVSGSFLQWRSAELIRAHSHECIANALPHFGNIRKLRAIVKTARVVAEGGFDSFKANLLNDPIETLMRLPFMGPATSRHLAKNIGLDIVKPDRHLVRLAVAAQYRSPEELCQRISWVVGDPASLIDTVLWRYSTLSREHLAAFSSGFENLPDS
jgi:hypothetical protein